MFGLLRLAFTLSILAGFVWLGATVPLGKHTLFGHLARIWSSDETQDMVEGTKETAAPAVEKVKRVVRAGVEATRDGGPPPSPPRPAERR